MLTRHCIRSAAILALSLVSPIEGKNWATAAASKVAAKRAMRTVFTLGAPDTLNMETAAAYFQPPES